MRAGFSGRGFLLNNGVARVVESWVCGGWLRAWQAGGFLGFWVFGRAESKGQGAWLRVWRAVAWRVRHEILMAW